MMERTSGRTGLCRVELPRILLYRLVVAPACLRLHRDTESHFCARNRKRRKNKRRAASE